MKYRPAQYAEALHRALSGKKEPERRAIARRFAQVLMRRRMLGRTGVILAAYEKILLRVQGVRRVRLESADPVSARVKTDISGILGVKVYFEEVGNPALLAGVKILIDDELLIDASARRQIDRMLSRKPLASP